MRFIRQNATHKVVIGPFVDVSDGFTPEVGVTLGAADEAEALRHDGSAVVDISGYTWAAVTTMDGYYNLTLQTGITNTVGHLRIAIHDDSIFLPVREDFTIVEEAVYDAMFASSADLHTAAISDIESSLVIVKSDLVIVVSDTTAIHSDTTHIHSDTTAIHSDTTAVHSDTTSVHSDTTAIHSDTTVIQSDSTAIEADLSNGTDGLTALKALIDTLQTKANAIEVDTQDLQTQIGTAGVGLTNLGGMSTTMKAQVNTEADSALSDYDGPTNAEFEARTPTAAQLAYIVRNAATALPVTFTTSGGSTTAAVLNLVDGASASATNDQYKGRLLVFTSGSLAGVVTDITGYVGSTLVATITIIPTAPTSSHTAVLI